MVGVWIYNYQLNENITKIEYKLVDEIDDIIHPEMSICILQPFLNTELQRVVNVSKDDSLADQYFQFLKGDATYHEKFRSINYEQVTPNLWDYLETIKINSFNGNQWKRGIQLKAQVLNRKKYVFK